MKKIFVFAIFAMMFFLRTDVSAASKIKSGSTTYYVSNYRLYMKKGTTTKYLTNQVEQILTVYKGKVYYEYSNYSPSTGYASSHKIMSINVSNLKKCTIKSYGVWSPYKNITNGRYVVFTLIAEDGSGSCYNLYSLDCAKNKINKIGKNVFSGGFMIANKKIYYVSMTTGKVKIYRTSLTGKKKKLKKSYKVSCTKDGAMYCEKIKKYKATLWYYDKKDNEHHKTFKFKK